MHRKMAVPALFIFVGACFAIIASRCDCGQRGADIPVCRSHSDLVGCGVDAPAVLYRLRPVPTCLTGNCHKNTKSTKGTAPAIPCNAVTAVVQCFIPPEPLNPRGLSGTRRGIKSRSPWIHPVHPAHPFSIALCPFPCGSVNSVVKIASFQCLVSLHCLQSSGFFPRCSGFFAIRRPHSNPIENIRSRSWLL